MVLHDSWTLVPAKDMRRVKALEAVAHVVILNTSGSAWRCSLCRDWDVYPNGAADRVRKHLLEE